MYLQKCIAMYHKLISSNLWCIFSRASDTSLTSIEMMSLFSLFLLLSLSPSPFFFLGVLKAVGHINDTLGPALIASVGVELMAARSLVSCCLVTCQHAVFGNLTLKHRKAQFTLIPSAIDSHCI